MEDVLRYKSCVMNGFAWERNEHKNSFEKVEKTSWQNEQDVLEYKSSLRRAMYLVNWITQRRTINTLDNLLKWIV